MVKKKYALVGKEISYSLSPIIYDYWFNKYLIDASYEIIDTQEINDDFFKELSKKQYNGLNITKPYKLEAIKYVNQITESVKNSNSCNNIVFKDNKIIGYNTDYLGLIESFKYFNINFNDKKILILGAGGSTYSLIYALLKLNIKELTIINKTESKILDIGKFFKKIKINNFQYGEQFDIILNTTSISFDDILTYFNIMEYNVKKTTIFYDLSYYYDNKKIGLNKNYFNGLYMLLYQAIFNFHIWFNIKPTINEELLTRILKK